MYRKFTALAGLAMALSTAYPALAQKSADTIRLAINDMFPLVDPYNYPQDEQTSFNVGVYQGLLNYDEHNGKYVNTLAKSWKRINDKTLEFEIKEGVKFHNGEILTAEDFKATYEWAADEKTRIRFKDNYNWIERVEVLGPHKMRLHSKNVSQGDLFRLAYSMRVLSKKALESIDSGTDYGRLVPFGTGPYKVVSLDKTKGVLVERFDGYRNDPSDYYRAPVKRVRGIPIPDRQSQQAQLLTGGLDIIRNVPSDSANELAKIPNLAVTATSSAFMLYAQLDAAGRSSNKLFKDERVRKAFIMSLDLDSLVKNIIPAGEKAVRPDTICFKTMLACKVDNKPYPYNPAEAKRLMAEAGYADGVDLTLYVHEPLAFIGTAIAGEIRKVGFRANVEPMPLGLYVKRRGDGDLTAFVGAYPTGVGPDAANMLSLFFGQDRDYWKDQTINDIWNKGEAELDPAKRTTLYTPALNRINEKAYILPISEMPMVWAHGKDVKIMPNPLSTSDPKLGDYAWTDYKPKEHK
jgi:peptide/nickel transport system substrate-binding protein